MQRAVGATGIAGCLSRSAVAGRPSGRWFVRRTRTTAREQSPPLKIVCLPRLNDDRSKRDASDRRLANDSRTAPPAMHAIHRPIYGGHCETDYHHHRIRLINDLSTAGITQHKTYTMVSNKKQM